MRQEFLSQLPQLIRCYVSQIHLIWTIERNLVSTLIRNIIVLLIIIVVLRISNTSLNSLLWLNWFIIKGNYFRIFLRFSLIILRGLLLQKILRSTLSDIINESTKLLLFQSFLIIILGL